MPGPYGVVGMGCGREGQGRAAARPLCSGRVVDREWVATQGPSKPLRPRKLGQLPTAWGAFCAGEARERSLPCQREVPSASEAEGFHAVCGCNGHSGKARRNPPGR